MGAKVVGLNEIQMKLKKTLGNKATLLRVIAPPMTMGAEAMMTSAKLRVPVDTGALRASGRVYRAKVTSAGVSVVLGFHKGYALYVHEDLTARHLVGESKFLEKAVAQGINNLERVIAKAVEKELRQ